VIALALTWFSLQSPYSEIEVRGNRVVPEASIRHYAALEDAFRRLWETGLFEDVRFDIEGTKLVVTVVEKPLLRESRIVGERVDQARLREGLSRAGFDLAANRPMGENDRNAIDRAAEQLLGPDFVVISKLEPVSDVQVDLVLDVTRRERQRIRSLSFSGNSSIADGELLDVMRLRPSGWISRVTRRDRFDVEVLEGDLERLRALCRSRGYAQASIGPPDVSFDAKNGVTIQIPVVEGEIHRFGALEVEPGSLLSREDARSFLPEPGSIYDANRIDSVVERITNHYLALGYPDVRVVREESSPSGERTVNVILKVVEGRFLRVGFVTFHGHALHRDRDLRQFLGLVESERFDPRQVDSTITTLMSTGNFLSVTPEVDLEGRPSRADVDFHVEEKPRFDYLVGGGLTGTEGGTGGGQILARGLLGRGESLRLDLDFGNRFQNVAAGYRDVTTLGRRRFLAADFRTTNLTYPDETEEDTTDVALRFGGPSGSRWQFLGSFRFSGFTLDSTLTDDVPFLTEFLGERFHTYRAGASLVHDVRDRPAFATRGRRLAMGYELVAGDVELQKLRAEATALAPLDSRGRHVVTLTGRAEALWSYGGTVESGVPRFERFFLGSENDLRGFPIRGVGPRSGANVVGGDRLVFASAEYRFSPVPRLGLAGFFDIGNVFATDFEGDPVPDFRYDVGAEAQILVPVANLPLRIGYGFNLDRLSDEPRGRFFVSLAVKF
jgi:outer membrane protein insertion porin family